jgi:hypothetical protein
MIIEKKIETIHKLYLQYLGAFPTDIEVRQSVENRIKFTNATESISAEFLSIIKSCIIENTGIKCQDLVDKHVYEGNSKKWFGNKIYCKTITCLGFKRNFSDEIINVSFTLENCYLVISIYHIPLSTYNKDTEKFQIDNNYNGIAYQYCNCWFSNKIPENDNTKLNGMISVKNGMVDSVFNQEHHGYLINNHILVVNNKSDIEL